jgi:putative ABC transport system ATP-binding protein
MQFISKYELTALMVTHNMQHAIDFGNRLLMMDEGKIILDLSAEEKKSLTVPKLVKLFKSIKKKDYVSDEDLLTE